MTKDILIWGESPNPRGGSIPNYVHQCISAANELKRNVFLISRNSEKGVLAFSHISGDLKYDPKNLCKKNYSDLNEILIKESDSLKTVGIVHKLEDGYLPPFYDDWETNNYRKLLAGIELASGEKPKYIKTITESVFQFLDILLKNSGIDLTELSKNERKNLYASKDLENVVKKYLDDNDQELTKIGFCQVAKDNALNFSIYALNQFVEWDDERADADVVVLLNREETNLFQFHIQTAFSRHDKQFVIYNASDFEPLDENRVKRIVHSYRLSGLTCYRGDLKEKQPVRIEEGENVILYVGRCAVEKGLFDLATIMPHLRKNSRFKMIFTGDFKPRSRKQLALFDSENASDYMYFTGKVDDVDVMASLYSLADITVIPSQFSATDIVGIESIRMGTPLVATVFDGLKDMYYRRAGWRNAKVAFGAESSLDEKRNKFNGVDNARLYNQLILALTNTDRRKFFASNGLRLAEKEYCVQQLRKSYARIYNGTFW